MANYAHADIVGRIESPYAMAYETGIPIYVLRRPRLKLAAIWPKLRHYE